MRRRPAPPAVLLLLVTLLVGGCSAEGGDASAGGAGGEGSAASDRPSPGPTGATGSTGATGEVFFVDADSDAVNEVTSRAQRSAARAMAPRQAERCNAAGQQGYDAWRACWHRLLDPLVRDLRAVAARFGSMAEQDLPSGCAAALRSGEERFTAVEGRVAGLLAGIDADDRAAQVRSMRTYDRVVEGIRGTYTPYFRKLTRACYSPTDLASIEAEAEAGRTAGPTASPEG